MHTQRRPRAGREVPNAMGWGHVSDLLQVLPTSEPRTVRLIGELDASNAEEFLDTLLPQLQGGGDLVLNLADLSFVDSMGLRSLLRLPRVLENTGNLLLDNPQPPVTATIDLA